MGILWVAWTIFVGGPEETSYVLFFLLAPVAAVAAGMGFGALCDRAPGSVQILLRGKLRKHAVEAVPAE